MRATKVVSFKLEPWLLEELDRACTDAGFDNRSACIRALLVSFVAAHERLSRGEPREEVLRELVRSMMPSSPGGAHRTETYNAIVVAVASMVVGEVLAEVAARVDELLMLKEYVEARGADPRGFLTPFLDPEQPVLSSNDDDDGGEGVAVA